jgi:hypothetical protein
MTTVNWSPDSVQAFRRDHTQGVPVGYLTTLNIGGSITLSADLPILIVGEQAAVNAAAVMSEIKWAGGPTDPISIAGVISVSNKHTVGNISSQSLANAEVTLGFAVYAFDHKAGTYFKAFHTGTVDVKGYVKTTPEDTSGSPFELHFDTQPAAEPKSPVVIPFSITVVPKGEEMDLHVATAKLQVQVWTWGVAA